MSNSQARIILRNIKRFFREAEARTKSTIGFIKAVSLIVRRDRSTCFYSQGREDQSGARIHDEIMAASFCYANKLKYSGPVYNQILECDETTPLRELLGLPCAGLGGRGAILPSNLYRERQISGWYDIHREKFIRWLGINLNSHPDTIFSHEFITYIQKGANLNIAPIKDKVVFHLRRGDVSSASFPNRYTSIDCYLKLIAELSILDPNLKFIIHSQTKGLTSLEIRDLSHVSELILDAKLNSAWEDMINAEILVIAKSSFSYVPALYSKATVIYQPFWHEMKSEWFNLGSASAHSVIEEVRRRREIRQSNQLKGTSKNTISPCVEAPIAYNLDS
jgi:hypothetical protein